MLLRWGCKTLWLQCGQLRLFIRIMRVAGIYPVRHSELLLLRFECSNIWVFASTFSTVKLFAIFMKISTLVPKVETRISVLVRLTKLTWVFVKYSASVITFMPPSMAIICHYPQTRCRCRDKLSSTHILRKYGVYIRQWQLGMWATPTLYHEHL